MKRYLVFVSQDYYPGGGWRDFEKSFDDSEAAIEFARSQAGTDSLSAVVDLEQEKEIFETYVRCRDSKRELVECAP